ERRRPDRHRERDTSAGFAEREKDLVEVDPGRPSDVEVALERTQVFVQDRPQDRDEVVVQKARPRSGRLGRSGGLFGPQLLPASLERFHRGGKPTTVLDEMLDFSQEVGGLSARGLLPEFPFDLLERRAGAVEVKTLERETGIAERLVVRVRVDPRFSEMTQHLLGARDAFEDRLTRCPGPERGLLESGRETVGIGESRRARGTLRFVELSAELREVEPHRLEFDQGELGVRDRLLAPQKLLLLSPRPDLLGSTRGLDEISHVEDLLDLV